MSKFILGQKIEMTQLFDQNGRAIPVTLIEAMPNTVVQVKTKERDGYNALQLGVGTKRKVSKALEGHMRNLGKFRYLREFRIDDVSSYQRGQKITVDMFQENERVKVSGISKGKGFAGVVKRHGFKGLPHTHGQKHEERKGGSIGRSFPERVLKGTRMAGRMGAERATVRNLKIVKIDPEHNLLAVKGAVPGRCGTLLEIRG